MRAFGFASVADAACEVGWIRDTKKNDRLQQSEAYEASDPAQEQRIKAEQEGAKGSKG